MSSTFGNLIKISIFGESHGPYIGLTVDGLPAGFKINKKIIDNDLYNRHSHDKYSTSRDEKDKIEFISGIKDDKLTGAPLTFLIKNKAFNSSTYKKGIIRPSHADLTYYLKYNGNNDFRGGGFSSGRLTATLVVLGSICKQILGDNIEIVSQIKSIHDIIDRDINFNLVTQDITLLKKDIFSVLDKNAKKQMLEKIDYAKKQGDSVGGCIKTYVFNLQPGLGEPYFDSFESYISHLLFSIGGVIGVSFGQGIELTKRYGSQVNDQIRLENNKIKFLSNNSGGVNGGITNGNAVIINTYVKPTPSISVKQKSINLKNKQNIDLQINGAHDSCIVHRVKQVINALLYFAILDFKMLNKKNEK